MDVTRGKLMFDKLYACTYTYGEKNDNDIQGRHEHTEKEAKLVNPFQIMLSSFCGSPYNV